MKNIPSENVAKVQDSWHQQGFFVMQNGIHYLIGSIIRFHDGKKQGKSEGANRNSIMQLIILYRLESMYISHSHHHTKTGDMSCQSVYFRPVVQLVHIHTISIKEGIRQLDSELWDK